MSTSLMRAHEASYGSPAGFGVLKDFAFGKSPDCPTVLSGNLEERSMVSFELAVPVVTVSLDDELNALKHEVGLPLTEHGFVHLKSEPSLLELFLENQFNGSHSSWKGSPQAGLPYLFNGFRGVARTLFSFADFLSGIKSMNSALSQCIAHRSLPVELAALYRR